MKELLIKIKALFEGQGTDQAKAAVEGIGSAADKAGSGGLGKLQGWIDGAAAKAGLLGGAVSAVGASLISFATGAVTGAVSALAGLAQGFVAGIKGAADFGGRISDVMAKTGQSAQTVLVLEQAFKNAGMSAEVVSLAVNKLQRALAGATEEGAPTAAAFERLGLNIEQLRTMSADQAFAAIGEAISGLKDPTLQAQAAFELFGRSSVQLLTVLKDPAAFAVAAQQIGSLGQTIGRNTAEMDAFSDAVGALDIKKMQFFGGVASALAGDMKKAADAINSFDAGPAAQSLGYALKAGVDFLQGLRAMNAEINQFTKYFTGLFDYLMQRGSSAVIEAGQQAAAQAEAAKASAEAGISAAAETADQTMARIRQEVQGSISLQAQALAAANQSVSAGASAAQQGVASTAAEGQKQLGMTAEQMKAAVVQLAQEMAKGNADVVTPAMQALTTSVQEGFARIAGEITSVATTLAEAQRAQGEANQEAIREAVAGLGEAQQAANAETGRAIQAAIAAVQQSNSALASSVASAIGSLQGQLANLQAQINSLASRA